MKRGDIRLYVSSANRARLDAIVHDRTSPRKVVWRVAPLLANLYLHPVDRLMATQGWRVARYADDVVVLTESERDAKRP